MTVTANFDAAPNATARSSTSTCIWLPRSSSSAGSSSKPERCTDGTPAPPPNASPEPTRLLRYAQARSCASSAKSPTDSAYTIDWVQRFSGGSSGGNDAVGVAGRLHPLLLLGQVVGPVVVEVAVAA